MSQPHPETTRLGLRGQFLLLSAFFLTGATSLVFEVIWTRLLLLSLGATAIAMGAVLGAFMGGMAIGSALAGKRFVSRLDPVLSYALLEGWAGAYGLATPYLLKLVDAPAATLQFGAAVILLLPATAGMGASLPILVRAFGERSRWQAVDVGRLYAANTAGAVIGPLLAVFWLFPAGGLMRTLHVAAGVDLLVCLVLVASRRRAFPVWEPPAPAEASPAGTPRESLLRGALFVSGAAAMVYEVAWTRTLAMVYGSSVYGITIMLSTFLTGITGGSVLASVALRRIRARASLDTIAWLLAGTATGAYLSLLSAHSLPQLFVRLYQLAGGQEVSLFLMQFVVSAPLMLPAALCLGAMLPVAADVLASQEGEVGRKVSRLYTANLVGSALGATLAGAFLLGNLGIDLSVRVASCAALAAAVVLTVKPRRFLPGQGVAFVFALLVIMLLAPRGTSGAKGISFYANTPSFAGYDAEGLQEIVDSHRLLYYRDGPTASVAVHEIGDFHLLKINGKTDASDSPGDMQTQLLLAHLPLMARPARRVAVVGWGSGVTAGAVLSYPVEVVDAFEIEPAVVEASHHFDEVSGRPLLDPRLRLVTGDARAHLRHGTEPYDVIISEPSNPWLTGVANLFTQDYFRVVASRLGPDGVLCQWFHLYGMSETCVRSLVATFRSVFPEHLLFRLSSGRDVLLLGSRRPIRFSGHRIRELFEEPKHAKRLASVGIHHAFDLFVRLSLDATVSASFSEQAPINTDDNMYLELAAPRSLYTDRMEAITAALARHSPDLSTHLSGFGSRSEIGLEQAASLFTAGEHDRALAACEQALSLEPSFRGYKLLGQILDGLGRVDEARRALVTALSLEGGDDEARAFVRALIRSMDSGAAENDR